MSDFNREVRYYVIKIKNLTEAQNAALCDLLSGAQIPCTDCVVVESDWPNYEHTWKTVAQVASGTFVDPYAEVETLRQQLAESEARVAELAAKTHNLSFGIVNSLTDEQQEPFAKQFAELQDCMAALSSEPYVLRKQAEAVEQCWTDIAEMVFSTEVRTPEGALNQAARHCADYALRLRQQADEAEQAGGEK